MGAFRVDHPHHLGSLYSLFDSKACFPFLALRALDRPRHLGSTYSLCPCVALRALN